MLDNRMVLASVDAKMDMSHSKGEQCDCALSSGEAIGRIKGWVNLGIVEHPTHARRRDWPGKWMLSNLYICALVYVRIHHNGNRLGT